jgi:2-polyprenyl-6-methoxyphenol hydroxylase-like FAD-dependent oxidoreductase
MSLEDAGTLAYAISKYGEDASSLHKWEARRHARVQQVAEFNNLSAKAREAGKYTVVQWFREWLIWGVLRIKGPEGHRRLYGYDCAIEVAAL